MDVGLGWLGVGVGAVGCAAMYLLSGAKRAGGDESGHAARMAAGAVALLTLIFWAVAMQQRLPYSPGQGLAWGFLIGGAAGAAAIVLSAKLGEAGSVRTRQLSVLSMACLGLFGVSLTYLIYRGYPQVALVGFSIGAAMAGILGYFVRGLVTRRPDTLTRTWTLFAVTVAVGVMLAVYHFNEDSLRMWWPAPILMAVTVLAAGYIGVEIGSAGRFRERPGAAYALAVLTAAALVVGLSTVYSWRIVDTWQLVHVTLVGMAAAVLIAWLAASADRHPSPSSGLEAAAVAVLVVVAFAVAAFRLWSGLGIALGLVAGWTVALPALGMRETRAEGEAHALWAPSKSLLAALSLGLAILLFRLFIEQYRRDLGAADLRIHYTFVGALLGAIVPFLLASSLFRLESPSGRARALAGTVMLGLLAAAAPVVLCLVWEIRAVLGFVFGLIAAEAFLVMLQSTRHEGQEHLLARYPVGLLVIGAQLSAVQFVGPMLELEMTRQSRIWVLAGAATAGVVWLVVTGAIARRSAQ